MRVREKARERRIVRERETEKKKNSARARVGGSERDLNIIYINHRADGKRSAPIVF